MSFFDKPYERENLDERQKLLRYKSGLHSFYFIVALILSKLLLNACHVLNPSDYNVDLQIILLSYCFYSLKTYLLGADIMDKYRSYNRISLTISTLLVFLFFLPQLIPVFFEKETWIESNGYLGHGVGTIIILAFCLTTTIIAWIQKFKGWEDEN